MTGMTTWIPLSVDVVEVVGIDGRALTPKQDPHSTQQRGGQ